MDVAALDLYLLRDSVKDVPVNSRHLADRDNGALLQVRDDDFALCVGVIDAVAGADCPTVAIGELERHTGQRLIVRTLHILVNDQGGERFIVENEGIAGPSGDRSCAQHFGAVRGIETLEDRERGSNRIPGIDADDDHLGFAIQGVALHAPDFPHQQSRTRNEAIQDDSAALVGHVFAIGGADRIASAIRYEEGHPGQRLLRPVDILLNHDGLQRHVFKGNVLGIVGVDPDALLTAAQDIALRSLGLPNHIGVGIEVRQHRFS